MGINEAFFIQVKATWINNEAFLTRVETTLVKNDPI